MLLSSRLQLIFSDPDLAFGHLRSRLCRIPKEELLIGTVNRHVRFEFDFRLDPAVMQMYCGVYEAQTLRLLRRLLKEKDIFVDVGANIGYLTAYAASLVGQNGQVHSFEPVPAFYDRLAHMASLNPNYCIHANNCALDEQAGEAHIAVTSLPNIGWNTMVEGFMSPEATLEHLRVSVRRLDEYLREHELRRVALIKIDTEGYELPVLKGLTRFLQETASGSRPYLLIEVTPQAYPLIGTSIEELAAFLGQYAYSVEMVEAPGRPVQLRQLKQTTNVLCVPPRQALEN